MIKAIKVNLSETYSFIDPFLQMFFSAILSLFTLNNLNIQGIVCVKDHEWEKQ